MLRGPVAGYVSSVCNNDIVPRYNDLVQLRLQGLPENSTALFQRLLA